MLWILIEKELKSIIKSPKFAATFGVCAVLILLSFFIGIQEYRASVAQYDSAIQLVDQTLSEASNPWQLSHPVYRRPDPMQIFVSGVSYDIGRTSEISKGSDIKIEQSPYSNDPIFAVFRFLDFAFIVHVVLSLLAIVFTYDAVNGERERGTLKLVLSNSVPRAHYLFSKLVGLWIGLTAPILLSMLFGVLLLLIFRIPMQEIAWIKLMSLFGVSVLYYSFFITAALFVSSITRRSSDSFLVLLILWVCLVLIVPRGATMAAEQFVVVPSVADLQSQKDRYTMERSFEGGKILRKVWADREANTASMSEEEKAEYMKNNQARFMEENNATEAASNAKIAEFNRQLNENRRNLQTEQERLAFHLSRFSPASLYKLVAMNLCGTNTSMKTRYEERMYRYREAFIAYQDSELKIWQEKWARQRNTGVVDNTPYEPRGMPRFEPPTEEVTEVFRSSIIDFGLLSIYTIIAFAGAFVAFLRYDVR